MKVAREVAGLYQLLPSFRSRRAEGVASHLKFWFRNMPLDLKRFDRLFKDLSFSNGTDEQVLSNVSWAVRNNHAIDDDTKARLENIFAARPDLALEHPIVARVLGGAYADAVAGLVKINLNPQVFEGEINGYPFELDDNMNIRWRDCPPGTEFAWENDICKRKSINSVKQEEAEHFVYEAVLDRFESYLGSRERLNHFIAYCRFQGRDMRGVMLGREGAGGDIEFNCGKTHLLTIGTTGYGKFAANVAPTCLQYRGALCVIDPAGEAAMVTARSRFERHGQIPYIFDPFGLIREKLGGEIPKHAIEVTYNPLRDLDPAAKGFAADARYLADSMIVSRSEKDPFWSKMAIVLLRTMIMFVCTNPGETARDLITLRDYLAATQEEWEKFIFPRMMSSHLHAIRNGASKLQNMAKDTFKSVLSQCHTDLDFLEDQVVADALADQGANPFSFRQLLTNALLPGVTQDDIAHINTKLGNWAHKDGLVESFGYGGCSIYIVVPLEYAKSHAPLLRLISTLFFKQAMRQRRFGPPTLFIADETALLGRLDVLPTVYAGLRKHNVRAWTFWQDHGQIKSVYPDDESSITGNSIHILLGTTKFETAKYYSDVIGMEAKFVASGSSRTSGTSHTDNQSFGGQSGYSSTFGMHPSSGSSSGSSFSNGTSDGTSYSESYTHSRVVEPGTRPEEILERCGENSPDCLVYVGGSKPVWRNKVFYFDSSVREQMGRYADPNPWYS